MRFRFNQPPTPRPRPPDMGARGFARPKSSANKHRQERLAALRRQFVDGPALAIRGGGSTGSDSRGAVVIPGSRDRVLWRVQGFRPWGTLEAEKGVLVETDGGSRRVPAPCDAMTVRSLETDGRSRQHRAGWCAKEHGGATTKSSGSSHEQHSLAFPPPPRLRRDLAEATWRRRAPDRAAHARRVHLV